MTDETVQGGLDEPEELEPDQGSLALADAEDRHTREDWERAAAAVLRKTGRLKDDDSDAEVWDRLARRTLDEIPVSPLGTPALVEDLETGGSPDRAGDWDIRAHLTVTDSRQANEAALAATVTPTSPPSWTAYFSTSRRSSSTAWTPTPSSPTPTGGPSTRPPTWESPLAKPLGKRRSRRSTPECSATSSMRPG